MEAIVILFFHLIMWVFVFGILIWMVGKIVAVLPKIIPAPAAELVGVLLYCMLGLMAIFALTGDFGLWGTWGYATHRWR